MQYLTLIRDSISESPENISLCAVLFARFWFFLVKTKKITRRLNTLPPKHAVVMTKETMNPHIFIFIIDITLYKEEVQG